MAIDINEYRRERMQRAEAEAQKASAAPLLAQAEVVDSNLTGHDTLDKLIRAIQPVLEVLETNIIDSAQAGIKAPVEQVFREIQLQHVYMLGKSDAFKELTKIAQHVAAEEKKNSLVIPQ